MANYIVLEMDLNDKWWDKWFVVGGLSIDTGRERLIRTRLIRSST